jgi:hypothetical protein
VRRVAVVLLVACATAVLAIGPAYAETVPVKTWVNGLCTNLVDWRDDLEQQSTTFQSTVNDLDTVAEVKSAFVDFLDGAIASTKTMIANVKALGTPKVANGKGIAGVITTGIGEVQEGFKDARESAQDLPNKPAAFKAQVDKITKKLDESSERASGIFDSAKKKYDTKSVDAARKSDSDCSALN